MVLSCNLSLSNLKEIMTERGILVDHSTVHRWVLFFSPKLLDRFNRHKLQVARKWNVHETYVKVKGRWMYLCPVIDSDGNRVEFWFSKERDLNAAKRVICNAFIRDGRPERITIDGSQTNPSVIIQCDAQDRLKHDGEAIVIRSSKYLNNMIDQDHRRIKRRIRCMLGFKSMASAKVIFDWD
jgi:putative transposase